MIPVSNVAVACGDHSVAVDAVERLHGGGGVLRIGHIAPFHQVGPFSKFSLHLDVWFGRELAKNNERNANAYALSCLGFYVFVLKDTNQFLTRFAPRHAQLQSHRTLRLRRCPLAVAAPARPRRPSPSITQ